MRIAYFILVLITLAAPAMAAHSKKAEPRIVTGWVEKVHIDAMDAIFTAKLDTGAMTSSIDADIIELPTQPDSTQEKVATTPLKNEPEKRVIFSIKDEEGRTRILERPIKRWVKIKTKNGGFLRRPVITMTFCIAGHEIEEEVNLAHRDHFNYPVLIGRNMLKKASLLIDPARTYTADPSCPSQEVAEKL